MCARMAFSRSCRYTWWIYTTNFSKRHQDIALSCSFFFFFPKRERVALHRLMYYSFLLISNRIFPFDPAKNVTNVAVRKGLKSIYIYPGRIFRFQFHSHRKLDFTKLYQFQSLRMRRIGIEDAFMSSFHSSSFYSPLFLSAIR